MAYLNGSGGGRRAPYLLWRPRTLTTYSPTYLVAAQRPTVTNALSELARLGLVTPRDRGWLLHDDSPGEPLELQSIRVADGRG